MALMTFQEALAKAEQLGQLFYLDKVDITRKVETLNADGSTTLGYPTTPILINQSCSISYKKIDNPDTNDIGKNPLISILQIFIDKDLEIHKGDKVTAYKYDYNGSILNTYEGTCNEPIVYPTHQELQIILKDNA